MAGTPKLSAMDMIACAVPALAAVIGIVLCLMGNSVPAVVLAVLGLALGIAFTAAGRSLNARKSMAQIGFVIGLAGCIFVAAYTALTYIAFLAVQSF